MVGFEHQSFRSVLRQTRRAAGLTQEALAATSGVSVRTISDLERGISSAPQGESGRWLADALGLSGKERDRFFAAIRQERRVPGPKSLAFTPPPILPDATLGRETDIATVEGLLDRGERIVSLVGVGGIGKTRMASEVATRFADRTSGLVAWADLAPLVSADAVMPAVARALGVPDMMAAESARQLAEVIAGRPLLLALDNMEHVLDAAPAIGELVAMLPTLTVLVTSREALRISGERIVPIAPLAIPTDQGDLRAMAANPSVALFLRGHAEATSAHAAHGQPDALLLESAARIVRMVDGMPLAIELAAAQSGTMAPAGIADLLERSTLAVLASGRRDGPARFRTMEAALTWSADLLPGPAMRLLRLLGIFRGGFTTESAAGLASTLGFPHLVSALPTLANNFLVRPVEAANRYAMLEPVRMFAAAMLEEKGEDEVARLAHAEWFMQWAGRQALALAGADPLPALDALDDDLPNLQAALTTAIQQGMAATALETIAALRRFWEYRSHFRLAIRLIDDALATDEARALSPELLLESVFCSSYFSTLLGDVAAARRTAITLHDLAAAAGDREYETRALVLDAIRARYNHESPEEALPMARYALASAADAPGGYGEWAARLTLGGHLQELGESAEALPLLEAAVRGAADRGCALDQAVPLSRLGFTLLELGRLDEAERRLAAAAEIAHAVKGLGLLIFAVLGLARAAALRQDEVGLTRAMILIGAYRSLLERITMPSEDYKFSPYWDAANAEQRLWANDMLGAAAAEDLIARGRDLDPDGMLIYIRS